MPNFKGSVFASRLSAKEQPQKLGPFCCMPAFTACNKVWAPSLSQHSQAAPLQVLQQPLRLRQAVALSSQQNSGRCYVPPLPLTGIWCWQCAHGSGTQCLLCGFSLTKAAYVTFSVVCPSFASYMMLCAVSSPALPRPLGHWSFPGCRQRRNGIIVGFSCSLDKVPNELIVPKSAPCPRFSDT